MPALHPLETRLAEAWPPEDWQDVTVLVAVSGGADSVALLRALAALKTAGEGRLVAAHLNHQLRPAEAEADQALVVELCRRLGVACEVGRVRLDLARPEGRDGLEAAARRARYQFLEATAAGLGARFVVTAHTADDQAETILHRILRGTGIGGLAGMARARPLGPATLIRPLLAFRRQELRAYLGDLGQPYREDSSNQDTAFTRNRIRHELLPWLAEEFNAGVVDALLRLGSLAGEVQAVIDSRSDELADRCVCQERPHAIRIDAAALAAEPPYLVREVLMLVWRRQGWPMQAMGFAQWELLERMLAACGQSESELPAKQVFPGGVLAEATDAGLRLTRAASE
ncbi:MAG: tRNA lysidine(34) synthetase TilS [Thermoguttaceae bacterium]